MTRRPPDHAGRPANPAAPSPDRGAADPGHEPPLDVQGGLAAEVDRRDVNIRWLGASVLTALTGAALLGTAIYVAVQGDTFFAEAPERVGVTARPVPGGDGGASARKGDKLVRTELVVTARQSFRAPMTMRAGDREAIKVRPFVRIATNLSLTSGAFATNIPPFNPMRLFNEEEPERPADAATEVLDAEVSVMKRDLAGLPLEADAPALTDADVVAQVLEERRLAAEAGRRPGLPLPSQLLLARPLRTTTEIPDMAGDLDPANAPFRSIEVRVVPENVTSEAKATQPGGTATVEERGASIRKGETLETVLRANGATPEQIRGIVTALGGRAKVAELPEGQQMRLLIAPLRYGEPRQILRVVLYGERGVEAIAAANDRNAFVSVAPPVEEGARKLAGARQAPAETEEGEDEEGGVRLYESLYETALKHDLPRQTVEELIRIFGYDVDFQRRVTPGDTFEIFFTSEDEGGERPEILFAELSVGGEARRVFRHQAEDGTVDFFDEQGRSLKKFLIRKPISDGILRSGFGYRRHPILGYSKMHTGVDWSNKIGTPILAAGNGTVIKAEWDSGYGRRTEVQHTNGYVTAYSHQSRFAPGIKPGARVRQGQVIGYVGNTGLSTGPHLHYEVIVNGHFVDPMKIRLPRGRELEGRALAEFKRQRQQIEELLERAGGSARLAQTGAR